jgi:VWFA-related protein
MLSSSRRMWSLIGGLMLGAVTFAPTLAADQKKPLVFGTDVALVQVPVFVSGKGGHAVQGLSAKDFSVQQDGKDVDVVSFRFIDTTAPELQEEIRQTSAARRRFLLLFDKSFTDPFGLARARGAAKEFVRSGLAESDLVGVATFDFLRGIRLVANFTEDRRVVEHAIHTLGTASLTRISDPLAIAADFSSTDLTPDRDAINQGDTPAALLNDVIAALATRARSAEEQSYRARVMTLLESFDQLGLALRRVSGRKQVVYFSTGFSSTMLAGQDKVEQTRTSEAIVAGRIWEVDSDSRYGDARMRDMVQDSLQSLSRADAVVHSIDVAGIGQKEEYLQTGPTGMATRDSGGRDSLGIISEETGGRFFKDANNLLPVLREMADMTSRYYVLGVQPRDVKADGGFRKLRVKMKPKGMRISHRPGFFERSAIAEATPPTLQRQFEAAELLVAGDDGTPQNDTVPFRVLILPVPTDTEKQSLGIVVQIPRSSISATAGPLEVYGYATAASGDVAGHFAHFLRLDAEKAGGTGSESADFQGLSFAGRFDIPPGEYRLKFLAQRPQSGESTTRFFEVTVPERQASRGFLLPPLFMERGQGWLEVALRSGEQTGLPVELHLGGSHFVPRTDMSVRPGRREQLVLIAFDPATAQDPAVDVDIRSVLSDDKGASFSPGAIMVERVVNGGDGRRSYILGFTPGDIPPGDYTLRVHLGEAKSVLQSYTRLKVLPRETAADR